MLGDPTGHRSTAAGKAKPGVEVVIIRPDGTEAFKGKTDPSGAATAHLPERAFANGKTTDCSAYLLTSGRREKKVQLRKDLAVELIAE